jgi:hypothetical protein
MLSKLLLGGSKIMSKSKSKVRFVKPCASGGESPPSRAAKPSEFEVKTMNGKV